MNISTIMNSNVHACRMEDTLEAAARRMWENDLGCLPVLNSSDDIVGMITDRDICMAAYTQGLALRDIHVTSAMSGNVFFTTPDETIQEAESKMSEFGVRRLPVLNEQHKIVGVVTLSDLAREAQREKGLKQQAVSAQDVTGTLALICQPRNGDSGSHG